MGNCASPQYTKEVVGGGLNWTSTTKIVHTDGGLQEFRQPIRASNVLSLNPNSFLCNAETMYIGCHLPQVPDDEELQLGQLYFLMPLSKSNTPLSLQELCSLASKANASLSQLDMGFTPKTTLPLLDRCSTEILARDHRCCKIPIRIDVIISNFLAMISLCIHVNGKSAICTVRPAFDIICTTDEVLVEVMEVWGNKT